MKKVLVYAESEKSAVRMADALRGHGGFDVFYSADVGALCRDCDAYDALIVMMPSSVPETLEALKKISLCSCAGVVLVTKSETVREAEAALQGLGVAVVSLPINVTLFSNSLHTAVIMSERLRAVRRENERLRCTIDDLKLVDRAKCALIQYLNMTEADAHRFIEKQAMNKRVSKRDVALEILKTYE